MRNQKVYFNVFHCRWQNSYARISLICNEEDSLGEDLCVILPSEEVKLAIQGKLGAAVRFVYGEGKILEEITLIRDWKPEITADEYSLDDLIRDYYCYQLE